MVVALRFAAIVCVLASVRAARSAEPDPTDDFKYASDETRVLIVVQMERLRASSFFNRFEKAHLSLAADFRGCYGVELANVSLLVQADTLTRATGSAAIVHLKSPTTGEAVAAVRSKRASRFSTEEPPKFVKVEFNGFTIFVPKTEAADAFCLVDGRTVVSAPLEHLKKVLPLKVPPKHAQLLRKEWTETDPKAAVTLFVSYHAVIGGCKAPLIRAEVQQLTDVDLYELMKHSSGVVLSATFGRQLSLRATVVCRDEKGTEVVKEQYERLCRFAVRRVQGMALSKEIIEALGKVRLSAKGKVVEASLAVSVDAANTLLDTLLPASK